MKDVNDTFHLLIQFAEFLIAAAVIGAVLFIGMLITISILPKDNPLRAWLSAVAKPMGITTAFVMLDIPIDWIPGINIIYNVLGICLVIFSWWESIQEIRELSAEARYNRVIDASPLPPSNVKAIERFVR